jgi:hypothetical protein
MALFLHDHPCESRLEDVLMRNRIRIDLFVLMLALAVVPAVLLAQGEGGTAGSQDNQPNQGIQSDQETPQTEGMQQRDQDRTRSQEQDTTVTTETESTIEQDRDTSATGEDLPDTAGAGALLLLSALASAGGAAVIRMSRRGRKS